MPRRKRNNKSTASGSNQKNPAGAKPSGALTGKQTPAPTSAPSPGVKIHLPPPQPAGFSNQCVAGGAVQGCPAKQTPVAKPCYLQILQIEEACLGKFEMEAKDLFPSSTPPSAADPPKKRVFRVVTSLLPQEKIEMERVRKRRIQLEKEIKDALLQWTKADHQVTVATERHQNMTAEVAQDKQEADNKRALLEKAIRANKQAALDLAQAVKKQADSVLARGKAADISRLMHPLEKRAAEQAESKVEAVKQAVQKAKDDLDTAKSLWNAAKKILASHSQQNIHQFKNALDSAIKKEKEARAKVQQRLKSLVDFEHRELVWLNTHVQGAMPVIGMVSGAQAKWHDNWILKRGKLNASEPNATVTLTAQEGVSCGTVLGPSGLAHIDLGFKTEELNPPVYGAMTIPAQDIWQKPPGKLAALAKGTPVEVARWLKELLTYVFGAKFSNLRPYQVDAHACGVKLTDKPPRDPGSLLSAVMEVYPADLWEFSVTTPELMKEEFSYSRIQDRDGLKITREWKKDEEEDEGRDQAEAEKDKPLTLKPELNGWEVKLARNGVEEDLFGSIFEMAEGLAYLYNEIPRILKNLQDRVPSAGLKITFEYTVFNGQLGYGGQWREHIDHQVYMWRKFGIEATIVSLDLDLKYGIWLNIPGIFECEASANVKAKGSVDFSTEIEMADPFAARHWDFSCGISGKIGFEGGLTLVALGAEYLSATGVLSGGWTFPVTLALNQDGWRFSIGKQFEGLKIETTLKIPLLGEFQWETTVIAGDDDTVEFFHIPEQKEDAEEVYAEKYEQYQKDFLANRAKF